MTMIKQTINYIGFTFLMSDSAVKMDDSYLEKSKSMTAFLYEISKKMNRSMEPNNVLLSYKHLSKQSKILHNNNLFFLERSGYYFSTRGKIDADLQHPPLIHQHNICDIYIRNNI